MWSFMLLELGLLSLFFLVPVCFFFRANLGKLLSLVINVWLAAGVLVLLFVCFSWVAGSAGFYLVDPSLGLSWVGVLSSSGYLTLTLWQRGTLLAVVVPTLVFTTTIISGSKSSRAPALLALIAMVGAGCSFVLTTSIFLFFISFELMLVLAVYLLRLTSKSERVMEAVLELSFWTLFGSLCLFVGFLPLYFQGIEFFSELAQAQLSPLFLMFLCYGFGVKVPLWPCSAWLLKAHVEASTEFSILLSGVILKFGLFGLYRVLSYFGGGSLSLFLLTVSMLGMLESGFRVLAQRDLKRVVALTTIFELNWASFCLALGGGVFDYVALYIAVLHSVTTTAEFFVVDCLYRRFGSRDLTQVSGLYQHTPLLFSVSFLTTLITVGFPFTSVFTAKLLFFSNLLSLSLSLWFFLATYVLLILPLIFFKVWVPVWFGGLRKSRVRDLTLREFYVFSLCILAGFALGLFPGFFLL